METLASRLRAVRDNQRCGLRVWSRRIGFSASSVVRWEQGTHAPTVAYLEALAALGVNGHWLLTGHGDMLEGGSGNSTCTWLARVGLPRMAIPTDVSAAITMAGKDGVSSARLVKELGITRQRADEIITTAVSEFRLRRTRGGRYVLSSNVVMSQSESAPVVQGLLEHLPDVLRPLEQGKRIGVRFGTVRIPRNSFPEFWSQLVRPLESKIQDEPEAGDLMRFVLCSSASEEQ